MIQEQQHQKQLAINHLKCGLQNMYSHKTKNQQFAFKNQQIANTPYHLVKHFP